MRANPPMMTGAGRSMPVPGGRPLFHPCVGEVTGQVPSAFHSRMRYFQAPPFTEQWPWLIYAVLGSVCAVLGVIIASVARTAIAAHDEREAKGAEQGGSASGETAGQSE